jgi:hypothetical protein
LSICAIGVICGQFLPLNFFCGWFLSTKYGLFWGDKTINSTNPTKALVSHALLWAFTAPIQPMFYPETG